MLNRNFKNFKFQHNKKKKSNYLHFKTSKE